MAEGLQIPDSGLNTADIIVDPDKKSIHKRVTRLPGFIYGLNNLPEAQDYRRLVGRSIRFITDERWGLAIPKCTYRVEEAQRLGDPECWIDMDFIEGQNLQDIPELTEDIVDQLAVFLKGALTMAQTIKEERKEVVIPDLLGGVDRPHKKFMNFVVEKDTGKLWFVDVFPLAILDWRNPFKKRRYKRALTQAARATNHQEIIALAEEIKRTF